MTGLIRAVLVAVLVGGMVSANADGPFAPVQAFQSGRFGTAYADAVRAQAADPAFTATWNPFLGREDLDARLRRIPQPSTQCTSGDADAIDGSVWVLASSRDRKVVMFNDNHMHVGARAFLLMLLPALRKQGFTHIGFEALPPEAKGTDGDIPAEGFYTVEPLFAALLREAKGLGFTVFGYEAASQGASAEERFQAREEGQARNIAQVISAAPPPARFVIFAGFAHIQSSVHAQGDTRRYMASYLKEYLRTDPLTVDLTSCAYTAASPGGMHGRAYLRRSDRQPLISGIYAGSIGGQVWLPLPGPGQLQPDYFRQLLGAAVHVPASLRRYPGLVLVEGRGLNNDMGAVAYDRVLMRAGEDLPLYLPAGRSYELVAYGEDGTLLGQRTVRVRGN